MMDQRSDMAARIDNSGRGAVWHDDVAEPGDEPMFVESGKGCWITDRTGHRLFEGVSGHSCLNLGHGHEELIAAATDSFGKLSYCSPEHLCGSVVALSEKLSSLLGGPFRFKYATSGGGAIELAIEIARRHWLQAGQANKRTILAFDRGYHGSTGAAGFASGPGVLQSRYAERHPEFIHLGGARDLATGRTKSLAELRDDLIAAIAAAGADRIAALVVEPVGFAGGVIIPPAGTLQVFQEVCRGVGILLIVDEIITGFGRTGRWFGHQHEVGVKPDMVTLGKGITSAYFPLSAVAVAEPLYGSFLEPGNALGKMITMAGHPVGCDLALKTIEIMERDGLVAQVADNAQEILSELRELEALTQVREVRGVGHMWGIEFAGSDARAVDEGCVIAAAVERGCFERGLIILRVDNVLRLNPPLIASGDELRFVVETLREAVCQID